MSEWGILTPSRFTFFHFKIHYIFHNSPLAITILNSCFGNIRKDTKLNLIFVFERAIHKLVLDHESMDLIQLRVKTFETTRKKPKQCIAKAIWERTQLIFPVLGSFLGQYMSFLL